MFPRKAAAMTMVAALVTASIVHAAFAQELKDIHRIQDGVSRSHVEYHEIKVPRGKEMVLADLEGPGKIAYFYITPVSDLALKIFWDDETAPSIQAPLADFFGAMRGKTTDYHSQPMEIQHGCYMCYLPMPFAKRARFILVNDSNKDYSTNMAYGIDYERAQQYATEKSRLHCMWRRSNPVQDGATPLDKVIDPRHCGGKNVVNTRHTILDVKGRGHYVGNFLLIQTKNRDWWGEGVTFFHVDGLPMVHSAGTEDEYGSCWGMGGAFTRPYCGYLPDGAERHLLYRWYLANPVRFQQSLKVEIQDIHDFGPGADDYTSLAFWYQEEPHEPFALQPFAERTAPSKAREYKK